MNRLSELLKSTTPQDVEMMEKITPIIEAYIDGYIEEIDERFMALHQHQMRLVAQVQSMMEIMTEKEVMTTDEMKEKYAAVAHQLNETIRQQKEEAEQSVQLKI